MTWTAQIGEENSSGKLFYTECTSEDDKYSCDVIWEDRSKIKSTAVQKRVGEEVKTNFKKLIDEKIALFVKNLQSL